MLTFTEHDSFWASVADLPEDAETLDVLRALIASVLAEPRAYRADERRIRTALSPPVTVQGRKYPGLSLIYRLGEDTEPPQQIELLSVHPMTSPDVDTSIARTR